jgi:PST family polysaccharide transporter
MASLPPERRPRALERATALLSLIIFPLAIGLGLVAEPLIELMLTEEWQGVAPLLTVLTVLSVFRPITWVLSAYMEAQDRTTRLMVLELIKLAMLLGGFFALQGLGPRWAATSVGIAYGLNAIAGVWLVSFEGPSPRRLALGFLRPLIACAAMAGAVLGMRHVLDGSAIPLVAQVGIEITAGAIAYVGAAFVFCRATALDLIELVKGVIRRKRGGRGDGGDGDDDDATSR